MNANKRIFLNSLLAVFMTFVFANFSLCAEKASSVVAPGATVKTVKTGYNGTEGPATDGDGNVYFTEKTGNTIQKWTWADGKVTVYRTIEGGAIGQAFDTKGRLLICEFSGKVTRDDMKGGNLTVIADHAGEKKLHIPNDIWVAPNGGIYFTDFSFAGMPMGGGSRGQGQGGAPGGGMPNSGAPSGGTPGGGAAGGTPGASPSGSAPGGQPGGGSPAGMAGGGMPPGMNEKINPGDLGIDYISPDGKTVTRVADIDSPNGIIGTPDGKTIYAGDGKKIVSFKINPDGTLTDRKTFCEQGTDGMAVDENGNVYLTGEKAIDVYNSKGQKIEQIEFPDGIKIMKFGGKDRKTLFVSGNTAIYTLEMSVKGAPTALDLAKGKK
jgi:sugar lactone lactonase YvrE